MIETIEGTTDATGLRIAIIASRFNEEITEGLLSGATDCLLRHGAREADLRIVRVPGAFELPLMAKLLASSGDWDAIVALGALVRGETPHFDYISSQVSLGISAVALETGVPVGFGVLTCDTADQARARSGSGNNKGWEAAIAAIEMATLAGKL